MSIVAQFIQKMRHSFPIGTYNNGTYIPICLSREAPVMWVDVRFDPNVPDKLYFGFSRSIDPDTTNGLGLFSVNAEAEIVQEKAEDRLPDETAQFETLGPAGLLDRLIERAKELKLFA